MLCQNICWMCTSGIFTIKIQLQEYWAQEVLQTLFIPRLTPSFPSLQVRQVPRGGFSPSNHTDDGMVIRGHEKGRLLEKDEITLILGFKQDLTWKEPQIQREKKERKKPNPNLRPSVVIEKLMLGFQECWSCVCCITDNYQWSPCWP